jgi:hypothetical protein
MPKGDLSLLTWDDFLRECGPRTSFGKRTSSVRNFEEHFRRKTFRWQGEVLLIREGFDVLFLHAKSVIMVRMYPQRYLHQQELPDVALLFSEDKNHEVAPLNKGDWIEFEATMTAHGHRGDPEVMMLWDVKQATRPDPLSSSAVTNFQPNLAFHAFSREDHSATPESKRRGAEAHSPATATPTAAPVAATPTPQPPATPAATPAPPAVASGDSAATSTPAPVKEATNRPIAETAAAAQTAADSSASKASSEKVTEAPAGT